MEHARPAHRQTGTRGEYIRQVIESKLTAAEVAILKTGGLDLSRADLMIENAVGILGLPLGIGYNFRINEQDVLVPMAIEEPAILAASQGAWLARAGGGFHAQAAEAEMIGQIQVLGLGDVWAARASVLAKRDELFDLANRIHPRMVERGGGARDLEARVLEHTPTGPMLVIHVVFDCCDTMGANVINTLCEGLAPTIQRITGGRVALRVLSNLSDRRLAQAVCVIPEASLHSNVRSGDRVAQSIIEACGAAAVDPYLAAILNASTMTGVDSVLIATGNDWRAVEAGAHAYAARNGSYKSLTSWSRGPQGELIGKLELPLAAGTVGAATRVHPTVPLILRILGVRSSRHLAQVAVSAGLAQTLASLHCLVL